jgi:hypothetical protein
MRFVATALAVLALATPALAQTAPAAPPPSTTPRAEPAPAAACERRQANLGGIGRASVVAFTGAIFGDRVCATVANVSLDGVAARIGDMPATDALAVAPLGNGAGATLVLSGDTLALVPGTATSLVSAAVGPFVIAPGGQMPNFGGDIQAMPRVVLAYAGQRMLLIGTSPVTLVDLARALRDQPDLFGADAVERAAVLAAGSRANLALTTADGTLGTLAPATRYLSLLKR